MLEKSKIKSTINRKNVSKKQTLLHQPCFHSWEEKQVGCCKKFVCRSCGKMWMDKNPPFESGLRTRTFRESYTENKIDSPSLINDHVINQKLMKKIALEYKRSKVGGRIDRYSFIRNHNGLYLPKYYFGIEDQFPSSSVSAFKNGVRSFVSSGGVMMTGGGAGWTCPYDFCESFNSSTLCATDYTSTCDHTWVVTKGDAGHTVDFDNAASPAPLEAGKTYGLRATSTSSTDATNIYYDITAIDNVYLYVMINFDLLPDAGVTTCPLSFNNVATDATCALCTNSSLNWMLWNGTSAESAGSGPAADTTYHVWVEVVRNTSCSAYIATTATKPGAATVTEGARDVQTDRMYLITKNAGDIVFGKVRKHSSAIGSDPN